MNWFHCYSCSEDFMSKRATARCTNCGGTDTINDGPLKAVSE